MLGLGFEIGHKDGVRLGVSHRYCFGTCPRGHRSGIMCLAGLGFGE